MTEPDYGVVLTGADRQFTDEVRAFLASALTADVRGSGREETDRLHRMRLWQSRLHDAGLAAISWPVQYGGRGATPVQQLIFNAEMAAAHAPEPINRSAVNQLGPTIIQWGTDEQRRRYLPKILSGEEVWCQGFSEPDAGSDLAALKTRAELRGDELIINGQKIWTSKAQYADWIYILARTDPKVDKHRGISYILVPLSTSGIEVRPIRQITGQAEFNEVFFDSVRVPLANVVGPLNGGWQVAKSTLGYERVGQSRTHRIERRLGILVRMAREQGALGHEGCGDDGYVADRIVGFAARVEALRQISAQATAAGVRGVSPGPEASVAKLLTSEVDQEMANFGLELAGPGGTLERGSVGATKNGNVARSYLLMRAATFGAGTSEVQRNVIAEKLLGLPRDP
ncbi:acyl-CoA dehydrogenase [Mycobacterium malmoense]|uniref:acyl-CoA dehydrogenase family protein n=1 Tax=Mycobacterium malmoense TaxID=1780 RepID=UPI00080B7E9F|nr:acyl-CoA dehydrogenase family protein [Mycobacterium malmoense]OCB21660.1 acyl-CoA dehydrogenase [Mycobacterium malmoense]